MQLTSTTDYAIRIVCYLAAQRQMISTSELSQELSVPSSYIPKITKKLKQAGIIKACEGTNGGYMLAKQPENISLMKIISCVEETMAINRCLEEDRFCSRNLEDTYFGRFYVVLKLNLKKKATSVCIHISVKCTRK